MHRTYHKWFSPNLQRDMELLVFGHAGKRVLFFPTRMARFFDYENWGVIAAVEEKINNGNLQIFCVDSIDHESFYNKQITPAGRIQRHLQFEQYILTEVLPFTDGINGGSALISAGCSLGAYHAVNLAFKFPTLFNKVIGMSGRYDLTVERDVFVDLFDGYRDENVYFNMPPQYMGNLTDGALIMQIKQLEIIIAIGQNDAFFPDSRNLSEILWNKEIWNAFRIWEGEAHKPRFWRKMIQIYF